MIVCVAVTVMTACSAAQASIKFGVTADMIASGAVTATIDCVVESAMTAYMATQEMILFRVTMVAIICMAEMGTTS